MYAIFESGGRQHRAEANKIVKMDRLEAQTGDVVQFDRVLAVFDGEQARIGTPYLEGGKIVARVVQQGKDPKIRVFRYKAKEHYKRTIGHRQHFTQVQITEISA